MTGAVAAERAMNVLEMLAQHLGRVRPAHRLARPAPRSSRANNFRFPKQVHRFGRAPAEINRNDLVALLRCYGSGMAMPCRGAVQHDECQWSLYNAVA